MKMTPALVVIGGLLVFWCSVIIAIILPAMTINESPSELWRPWSAKEAAGHDLYVRNGCSYCHSQFVRVVDSDLGSERIAQKGDYVGYTPAILGTERIGPDLSQAGGEHPDDWQLAHFTNPRYTRPMSLMPSWEFLGPEAIGELTAYVQSLGGQDADRRVKRQMEEWKPPALAAYDAGPEKNIAWLHDHVPRGLAGDAESVPGDRGGPGARTPDLPAVLHQLPRPRRRRRRAGRRNISIRRR